MICERQTLSRLNCHCCRVCGVCLNGAVFFEEMRGAFECARWVDHAQPRSAPPLRLPARPRPSMRGSRFRSCPRPRCRWCARGPVRRLAPCPRRSLLPRTPALLARPWNACSVARMPPARPHARSPAHGTAPASPASVCTTAALYTAVASTEYVWGPGRRHLQAPMRVPASAAGQRAAWGRPAAGLRAQTASPRHGGGPPSALRCM